MDLLGGTKVTLTWERDNVGSGVWGDNTPAPVYPIVDFPDGTLVRSLAQPGVVFIVFGGAKFRVDAANTLGLNLMLAQLVDVSRVNHLASAPVDGTLLREVSDAAVYVFYGGAKFWIPDLFALDFNWDMVHIVPPGTLSNIPIVPRHGTLLKEQTTDPVYLVKSSPGQSNQLCWVTSPAVFDSSCLSWRNLRVVPDGSLNALPKGPNIS